MTTGKTTDKATEKTGRAPRSFKVDEPPRKQPTKGDAAQNRKPRSIAKGTVVREISDEAAQRVQLPSTAADLAEQLTPPPPNAASRRPFRWSRLFWFALAGLVSLSVGIWVDQLIRDLFARHDILGWLASGFLVLLIGAAAAIVLKEGVSLRRMAAIDGMRARAGVASMNNDAKAAKAISTDLLSLYASRPDMARGRKHLQEHAAEVIDGRDLIALAERDLIAPLDATARNLVMGSSKRVSIVTAVSPRALVDVGFVLVENMRLIRRLADLYGGRPGTLGFWRLTRNVLSHLAVTGSIAVGDSLIQQLIGHGLAARISSRLGEGVVNGLLTARVGVAAIDVCRPLPFTDQTRPAVKDFMAELVRGSTAEESKNENDPS